MFGRSEVTPFAPMAIGKRAAKAWRAAALEPITLHECRHTFASLLIDSDANPKAVQEFMGHSKIATTFDTYGHLFPGSRDEVRERMDAYLAPGEVLTGELTGEQAPNRPPERYHHRDRPHGQAVKETPRRSGASQGYREERYVCVYVGGVGTPRRSPSGQCREGRANADQDFCVSVADSQDPCRSSSSQPGYERMCESSVSTVTHRLPGKEPDRRLESAVRISPMYRWRPWSGGASTRCSPSEGSPGRAQARRSRCGPGGSGSAAMGPGRRSRAARAGRRRAPCGRASAATSPAAG